VGYKKEIIMIPNNMLPKWLKDVSVDSDDREEYVDAMSNALRLLEYFSLNDDVLQPYDYLVMLKIETERDHPRKDVAWRMFCKYQKSRRHIERDELFNLFED
jgi:hypothetical protein